MITKKLLMLLSLSTSKLKSATINQNTYYLFLFHLQKRAIYCRQSINVPTERKLLFLGMPLVNRWAPLFILLPHSWAPHFKVCPFTYSLPYYYLVIFIYMFDLLLMKYIDAGGQSSNLASELCNIFTMTSLGAPV